MLGNDSVVEVDDSQLIAAINRAENGLSIHQDLRREQEKLIQQIEDSQLATAISLSLNVSTSEVKEDEDRDFATALSISLNEDNEDGEEDGEIDSQQEEEDRQLALILSESLDNDDDQIGILLSDLCDLQLLDEEDYNESDSTTRNNSSEQRQNSVRQQEENVCVICQNEESTRTYVPCAHRVLCQDCSEEMTRRKMMKCPICRTQATGII